MLEEMRRRHTRERYLERVARIREIMPDCAITTDVITYLFTALIIWIASRPDGVLEDQPHYVRRIAEEENH